MGTMTDEDYGILAEALLRARPPEPARGGFAWTQWRIDVLVIADTLKDLDPQFKYTRFYETAGATSFKEKAS